MESVNLIRLEKMFLVLALSLALASADVVELDRASIWSSMSSLSGQRTPGAVDRPASIARAHMHRLSRTARDSVRAIRFSRCALSPPANVLRDTLVLASGSSQPFNRSIVVAANAFVQTRVCYDHTTHALVRPYVIAPQRFSSCAEDIEKLVAYSGGTRPHCLVPGTSLYEPCPTDHATALAPGRFCFDSRGLPQTKVTAEHLRTFVDLPHVQVTMQEALVHTTNIGHFSRDVLFVVSMARQARQLGWRTFVARPSKEKMNGWGAGILDALTVAGWVQPADTNPFTPPGASRNASTMCIAQAAKITYDGLASKGDMDELGCVVRAKCGVLKPERRTLLHVTREGRSTTRTLTNLAEATPLMQNFADVMGWDLKTVVFGGLSLCEQVELVSAAAVVLGVHGADIANAVLARPDTTLVEAYPVGWGAPRTEEELIGGRDGPWANLISPYASQMELAGRRHVIARLFDVHKRDRNSTCNANVSQSTDWQFHGACVLHIDLERLRDLLSLLKELHAPETVSILR